MLSISLQLIHELAKMPKKGSKDSAGYDLFSIEECVLSSMERKLFKIGLKLSIPVGYYGRIAPRSGLALKDGIDVLAGVIDSDYRGEVGVLLINLSTNPLTVKVGDKIAQIIFEQYKDADFNLVESLDSTVRDEGGFGHTDKVSSEALVVKPSTHPDMVTRWKEKLSSVGESVSYEKLVKEREQNLK